MLNASDECSIMSCEKEFKGRKDARQLEFESIGGDGKVFIWEEMCQCSKINSPVCARSSSC